MKEQLLYHAGAVLLYNSLIFPFVTLKSPYIYSSLYAPVKYHGKCDTDHAHAHPFCKHKGEYGTTDDCGKYGVPHGELNISGCS